MNATQKAIDALRDILLLLCTGGPACRIVGEFDENGEPDAPRVQFQDWGTPWTDYTLADDEAADVLAYCREYYFGE